MSGSFQYPMMSEDIESDTNEMNLKKEMSADDSAETDGFGDYFMGDVCPTETPYIVDDVKIKHEELDFQHNHNSTADHDSVDHSAHYLETVSTISRVDDNSSLAKENDLHDFYLNLLHCDPDCDTCQNYIILLNIHIRATHVQPQPFQDPLLIDPLDMGVDPTQTEVTEQSSSFSSSFQIKCEANDNGTEKMQVSMEESKSKSESDPDFELESESESDPDYTAPYYLARKVHKQGSVKNHGSSDNKAKKPKRKILQFKKGNWRESGEERGNWKCNECGLRFLRMIYLKRHMLLHGGENPFKCDVCEESFSLKGNLTTHKRIHTGKKTFQCDECDQCFSFKCVLTAHMRVHTGEKPFVCDECGKGFTIKGSLNLHMRVHTREKPFVCDVCSKWFSAKCSLNTHMRIHTGEKPFQCNLCDQRFTQNNALNQHKRKHTGQRPHKCDQCTKSYTASSHLINHKKTHH